MNLMALLGWLMLGGMVSRVMAARRSPHAAWPITVALIYVLGQMYGLPLILVYMGFSVPWIIMGWIIVIAILVAIVIGFNYAWNCSTTKTTPSFAGYKTLAVQYTAKVIRQKRTNRKGD